MLKYLVKRIAVALFTVWVTTVAVSMLIHVVPGDPVRIMYAQSQGTTPQQLEQIRHRLGLDRPLVVQYGMYVNRLVHGDWGTTIRGEQPVLGLLLGRFPNTLLLAASSLLIAAVIGLTTGFIAAYRRNTWVDTSTMVGAIVGASLPQFWLGLILLFFFVVQLQWFPVAGSGWRNLVLPALTLGLSNAAIIARLTRSSMVDVFSQDFMRTAWSKGLPKALVLFRHALRAGLVPVVTMMGMQFTYMMGGAIVVENVFSWNGVGRLAIQAITQRDYPVIQGFILMFAVIVATVSVVLDLLYAWLDPRVRYG